MTPPFAFRFASARTANRLVAGVPAAARLARAFAAAAPGAPLVLVIADGGALSLRTMAEIARAAPGLAVTTAPGSARAIPAETLPGPATIAALLAGTALPPPAPADPEAALRAAARAIIRATAKPGDGMVSRRFNRPLSQAISARLLRLGWVRPGHATMLTMLAALAMLACLVAVPSPAGLAAGTVLFQLASVIDGVDGEIARATWRTSRSGASLDSLVDAFTNCAFLAGAGVSFLLQGDAATAAVCAASTAWQVTGLAILGRSAWRREGVIHFDSAKPARTPGQGDAGSGGAGQLLKDLTSRDFYCFALMLTALAGVLGPALWVFAAGLSVWLAYVVKAMLIRGA